MSLVAELQRRRVFRALVGYGIAAFAILQIVEPIMHGLHWPEAVLSYVVVALAVGFPTVVILAWIFDVNAGRVERTGPAARETGLRGARLALLLVGIGVLAAAPGVAWYFTLRSRSRPAAPSSDEALRAKLEAAPPGSDIRAVPSIAVLPFVNLSSDKEQEYFSDGISEEILNALAQVQGLHVAGRTSSFSFKGKNEDLASIASKLHVAAILEGSVRKSGHRVRVTAQLINAADGFHLWSNQYDRKLKDIFEVQSELATAVVEALKIQLLPGSGLSVQPARNPEAYRLFLLGRSLLQSQTLESERRSEGVLERAVALEPSYGPAWELLAAVRGTAVLHVPAAEVSLRAAGALNAAERAIALSPTLPGGYAIRGWIKSNVFWDWAGAQSDLKRALALSSETESRSRQMYATLISKQGRLKEAIAIQRKVAEFDPLNSYVWVNLGGYLTNDGQLAAARSAHARALESSPDNPWAAEGLATLDLLEGHPAKALSSFNKVRDERARLLGVAVAQHDLGHARESQEALDLLAARAEGDAAYGVASVHAWRGEQDAAFEWLERAYERHDLQLRHVKIDPLLRKLRGDPRYRALLQKMKLPVE